MEENTIKQELDSSKVEPEVETVTSGLAQVEEPTVEEMVKNPEYIKKAMEVANNLLITFGPRWVKFSRFAKSYGSKSRKEFSDLVMYLRSFDLAVVKMDRGELKFKIDFTHEVEIELIREEILAVEGKKVGLELRMQKLIDIKEGGKK